MGKAKGGKGAEKGAAKIPKCTCDHPYTCSCGNRPERPSKGHRWDPATQQWGGKGHRQKGGSGQTSSVAQEAQTTEIGKTTVAQWQKLPSTLLAEVTRKESQPQPKYKSIGKYKFRVIIQDAKASKRGTEHDMIFVPAEACGNEEQAREEAALLALLHLTPNIPHERKLPEPYKTTWINAINAAKDPKKHPNRAKQNAVDDKCQIGDSPPAAGSTSDAGAQASTNLSLGRSFVSFAERKREQIRTRQERNARIQRHEAVRLANRDHQVFMSAQIRKRIENLLRGDSIQWEDNSSDEENNDDDLDSDLKAYVVERLHSEGFSKTQAKTSYAQFRNTLKSDIDEEHWESVYDECLQWLCIHMDEDQLPEGFDPRGRTLDVIVNQSISMPSNQPAATQEAQQIARKYGLAVTEAASLVRLAVSDSIEQVLWNALCSKAAATLIHSDTRSEPDQNLEIARDELEALEGIFPSGECQIQRQDDITSVVLSLPVDGSAQKLQMKILTRNGVYPSIHPDQVLIYGFWSTPVAVAVQVKLIQFLSELPLSEPMIFEIYGQAQNLLEAAADGEIKTMPLSLPSVGELNSPRQHEKLARREKPTSLPRAHLFRPKERASFWSTSPKLTPKAVPFPEINGTIRRQRDSLPAAKARGDFLVAMHRCLSTGRVVLVTGDTGCGKTTQIPQFILEASPEEAKIVVAQPRRLAATGVASRVANERGESQPGIGTVGYLVRGDVAMSERTRLMFCTTGVLLRQLHSESAFDGITHVIVDEVHERHLDSDILLGVLKDCLGRTPHLRVVLMSATLDADRFAAYWGPKTPRLHIPGRTFPVVDFMLEDVLALTGYIPPKKGKKSSFRSSYQKQKKSNPWADSERSDDDAEGDSTLETEGNSSAKSISGETNAPRHTIPIDDLVKRVDESHCDFDMIGQLVKSLIHSKEDSGSILVFMSGAPEINKAMSAIENATRGIPIDLLPLHGGLQPKDQNKIFSPARSGHTKIIVSTNIAETSITIPDCTFVIDSCREKQSSYDPVNRMPILSEGFAAKASLMQRRGRAGRVQTGTCYKLISRATYDGLEEHGTPEIHRCALDQILLLLLFLGIETGSGTFFQALLDPPSRASVESAILGLQKLGAVAPRDIDGNTTLTPLGMHLAGIPAPPTVGKIMIMGSILGCRSAALAMAAGMSMGRSPFMHMENFSRVGDDKEKAIEDLKRQRTSKARKELFKTVGNSDHAMLAAAFLQWDSCGDRERRSYCDLIGLNVNGMRDMKQLFNQLHSSLAAAGYDSTEESDQNVKSWRIIRACAVAALAPSQLVRVHRPSTKYAETIGGAKEKDGEAKELKFFIQASDDSPKSDGSHDGMQHHYFGVAEERVFIHPASANFATGNFSCPWLVYHEMLQTSKAFLRDCTECSAYALLLFGGKLDVQASNGVIVVADWVRLAANARIGALIGGLRKMIDEQLIRKVRDPTFDIASSVEMKLVRSLLVTDGLGQ